MRKLTEEESILVDRVESAVCRYFNVPTNALVNIDKKANSSMARGYVLYILHVDYKLSIGKLSDTYFRTTRAVFWHISKIKSLIKQRVYREIYQSIISSI